MSKNSLFFFRNFIIYLKILKLYVHIIYTYIYIGSLEKTQKKYIYKVKINYTHLSKMKSVFFSIL